MRVYHDYRLVLQAFQHARAFAATSAGPPPKDESYDTVGGVGADTFQEASIRTIREVSDSNDGRVDNTGDRGKGHKEKRYGCYVSAE